MFKSKLVIFGSLIVVVVLIVMVMFLYIQNSSQKYKGLLENSLLQEAVAHYESMVMSRSWNAGHGGVFVKEKDGLKPNPYLRNNFIKSDKNETLIKINPAWMTRQISEISNEKSNYYYKITSLKPINPSNKADGFETEALNYLEKNRDKKYYYKINNSKDKENRFDFLGELLVTKKCMKCHSYQGYKVGNIRGGLRVTIPTQNYQKLVEYNENKKIFFFKIIIVSAIFIIFIISWLLNKNYRYQEKIEKERKTFQNLINLQDNIVIITDGIRLHYGNQAFLNFFNYSDIEAFLKDYNCICDRFEHDDDYFHLGKIDKDINWVYYLSQKMDKEIFVKIVDDDAKKYSFSVHLNEFENQLFIITFSDISDNMKKYLNLEKKVLLENMLIAESRVDAMADIIKMLSHQWRQPLTAISMINAGMIVDVKLDEFSAEELLLSFEELEKELEKLSAIFDSFNNIYAPTSSLDVYVDLTKLLENCLNLKQNEFEENHIQIETDLKEKIYLDTHSKDLIKIILDILTNAQEAIVLNKIKDGVIKIGANKKDQFIIIDIEDNGGGMDESIMTSIFEPYFTTKSVYNETGLSLFVARMMLERSLNASIEVANEKDGAKFTITIKM